MRGELACQVVRDLAACGDYYAMGAFELHDIEHPLEGELLEIKPVGLVVIGRDCFRIGIYHDGIELPQLQCAECLYT